MFCEDLEREREDEKGNLFRVAEQLVNRNRFNRDVVGANCVKNSDGKIVAEEARFGEHIMMCYQMRCLPGIERV